MTRQYDFLWALGAFLIAFLLWQFSTFAPIIYPLRLFVTFIHELGHGIAALATGGDFLRFEVQSNGAGLATSRGGIRPIIISAGYVGTAVFGAVLLWITNHAERPRWVAGGLGAGFIGLTLIYSGLGLSNFDLIEFAVAILIFVVSLIVATRQKTEWGRYTALAGFAIGFLLVVYFAAGRNTLTVLIGVLSGAALLGLARYGSVVLTRFILNFLAVTVGLNAITDAIFLFRIVSSDAVPHNDATSMASVSFLPATFWALTWIILAIILLGGASWLTFWRPLRNNQAEPEGATEWKA